jgi:hypothetical protein
MGETNGSGCMQRRAIERATSTLGCTESAAVILLRHFRWNFDILMGALLDSRAATTINRRNLMQLQAM